MARCSSAASILAISWPIGPSAWALRWWSARIGALLGVAFVKAEGNQLTFGASVGSPDPASDEYVPLIVKVDNFGNYSVTKDTKADVNSMNIDPETEDE